MRLTDKDREILACAYFQADAPVSLIAKQSGYPEHVVRSAIHKMLEHEIIERCAVINPYALGLRDFYLEFSFSSAGSKQKKRALDSIEAADEVAFLAELGGDFQYGAAVFVPEPIDVLHFLDRMSQQLGPVLVDKHISTVLSLTHFSPGHLTDGKKRGTSLSYDSDVIATPIDELDHQILRGLTSGKHPSNSSLAREMGVAATTLDYRIKMLKSKKVIVGVAYFLRSALKVSRHPFAIQVLFARHSPSVRRSIIEFCQKHPAVHYHADSLGRSDCEIGASFEEPHLVNEFVALLGETFKEQISQVWHYPILRKMKLEFYPFKKKPTT
ncbi:MAG: Lrp/AsnC family transcriptional regulator [Proteobacteria bacterium]|nr:Lrp/AsnC family transcriptional regulator [Pseudomonadota bacterium]